MSFDRILGVPIGYGDGGFMHGTDTVSAYGWNHPRAFGHVGLSNSFTWPTRNVNWWRPAHQR